MLGRDSVGWDVDYREVEYGFPLFQSLGRDSVGWDVREEEGWRRASVVSIPRSGFCGVGPEDVVADPEACLVSIPRSGFCGVGHLP